MVALSLAALWHAKFANKHCLVTAHFPVETKYSLVNNLKWESDNDRDHYNDQEEDKSDGDSTNGSDGEHEKSDNAIVQPP